MKKGLTILAWAAIAGAAPLSAQSTHLANEARDTAQLLFQRYVSGYDAHGALQHLVETQQALKATKSTPEIHNLLKYIDLCIERLRRDLDAPFSQARADRISDAIDAIREANSYIIRSEKGVVVAVR
jgi:GH18 family chitinase